MQIETVGNLNYAGTNKFISHVVLRKNDNAPMTPCGLDVYGLMMRRGQQWEYEEVNSVQDVGCLKCKRHLTQRPPDAGEVAASTGSSQASAVVKSQTVTKRTQRR